MPGLLIDNGSKTDRMAGLVLGWLALGSRVARTHR
jgi:hypothetical protein